MKKHMVQVDMKVTLEIPVWAETIEEAAAEASQMDMWSEIFPKKDLPVHDGKYKVTGIYQSDVDWDF